MGNNRLWRDVNSRNGEDDGYNGEDDCKNKER